MSFTCSNHVSMSGRRVKRFVKTKCDAAFPNVQIPKFPNSQMPKYPNSQIPKFPNSPRPGWFPWVPVSCPSSRSPWILLGTWIHLRSPGCCWKFRGSFVEVSWKFRGSFVEVSWKFRRSFVEVSSKFRRSFNALHVCKEPVKGLSLVTAFIVACV
jgi:hypothetical protein